MRLQPLPCSKEVLPVAGRPVMEHALDRMEAAGCDEVRVVTRPEKDDVMRVALGRGATVVGGHPGTLADSIALGLEGLDDDTIVLVAFPDSIWWPEDGLARLAAAVTEGAAAALGLFRVEEPWRSDVVTTGADGRVVAIDVKPAVPASDWIWGCLAARAGALRGLDRHAWPGQHLLALAMSDRVVGVRLSEDFVDVGTPAGLLSAKGWLARHAARA